MSVGPLIVLGSGPSALTLAGEDDIVEGPLRLDGRPVMDLVQLAFAASQTPVNRGNRARTLEFSVKRAPAASAIAAMEEVFLHELLLAAFDVPTATPLSFTYGEGDAQFTVVFSDVVVTHRGWHQGTTAIHSYSLTAGAMASAELDPLSAMTYSYIDGFTDDTTIRALPTLNVTVSRNVMGSYGGRPKIIKLFVGTDADNPAGGVWRGDDYHAVDNPRVWKDTS